MQGKQRASRWFRFVLSFTVMGASWLGCDFEAPVRERVASFLEPPEDLGPPRRVFAKRFVAPIREAPRDDARRLGYLRAGALLSSTTSRPVETEGCVGGWFELQTGGFVCAGQDVTLFDGKKLPERRAAQPDRNSAMPYDFATVRARTPLYRRLPARHEVVVIPPRIDGDDDQVEEPPDNPLVVRVLEPGFYVSLDRTFERDGVTYWRTQQNGFVPDAALRRKPSSEFQGVDLGGAGPDLPIAVTRRGETEVYRVNARDKVRRTSDVLSPRTWLEVRGRRRVDGDVYLLVGDDRLVRESAVKVIAPRSPPSEVQDGDRWIDIDLTNQSLVAYDWLTPRYVTLISSGRLKTPRPELDYTTPRGLFRIRAKHLTATMDNDEPGEPPYSLEDVPYVMYFEGAYAFHSAFWHNRFGRPRSHGCINLAPKDAKRLYNWSGPNAPDTWHGTYANDANPGTWVWVHGKTPR